MENNVTNQKSQQVVFDMVLEEVLRQGARQLLQQAIEVEVAEYINRHLLISKIKQKVDNIYTGVNSKVGWREANFSAPKVANQIGVKLGGKRY